MGILSDNVSPSNFWPSKFKHQIMKHLGSFSSHKRDKLPLEKGAEFGEEYLIDFSLQASND